MSNLAAVTGHRPAARRRARTGVVVAVSACTALAGCASGGSATTSSAPPASTAAAGASTSAAGASTAAGSPSAGAASGTLPGCMIGSWQAPVRREAEQLDLARTSKGAIRSVSGTARMTYTARAFTFTYDKVSFDVNGAGAAKVTGSLQGTWSMKGATLHSKITKSKVKVSISVGGTTIPADDAFNGIATGLAPNDVTVACTPGGLAFTSHSSRTVTFDKA